MVEKDEIYTRYREKEQQLRPHYKRNSENGYYETALHKAVLLAVANSKENTQAVVDGINNGSFVAEPAHISAELSALTEIIKKNADNELIVQKSFDGMEKLLTSASIQTVAGKNTEVDAYFLIDLADLRERKPFLSNKIDNFYMIYQWINEAKQSPRFVKNTQINKAPIKNDILPMLEYNAKDIHNRLNKIRQQVKIGKKSIHVLSKIKKSTERDNPI